MSYITSASRLIDWLVLATTQTSTLSRVKERYKMNSSSWSTLYRPDCNMETAYAFLKHWEYTEDAEYLQLARKIYESIVTLQNADGSFPFANSTDTHVYTNDNSEVPIFLFRMSEIDTEKAQTYISTALETTDFLVSIQNENGSWRVVDNDLTQTAMFTAHAVGALSVALPHASQAQKTTYLSAIENGLSYIHTQITRSGRVYCCSEKHSGTEYWRPPSSDQSITIRGYALAEYYAGESQDVETWKSDRLNLISWLDQLIAPNGAVRNGLGEAVNAADIYGLTDHVYTTAFAIEAYWWSSLVDDQRSYMNRALKIGDFAKDNLYFGETAETYGVIRGAYNLIDDNWDTSELIVNPSEEGGANMIYSGWVNAPLAALFYDLDAQSGTGFSYVYNVDGNNLEAVYDSDGNQINVVYDINGNILT